MAEDAYTTCTTYCEFLVLPSFAC